MPRLQSRCRGSRDRRAGVRIQDIATGLAPPLNEPAADQFAERLVDGHPRAAVMLHKLVLKRNPKARRPGIRDDDAAFYVFQDSIVERAARSISDRTLVSDPRCRFPDPFSAAFQILKIQDRSCFIDPKEHSFTLSLFTCFPSETSFRPPTHTQSTRTPPEKIHISSH